MARPSLYCPLDRSALERLAFLFERQARKLFLGLRRPWLLGRFRPGFLHGRTALGDRGGGAGGTVLLLGRALLLAALQHLIHVFWILHPARAYCGNGLLARDGLPAVAVLGP